VHFLEYDTRLAAKAWVVREQEVLLVLEGDVEPPRWGPPGGGVEFNESVEQAVMRELAEETGYTVALGGIAGVHSHVVSPMLRKAPGLWPPSWSTSSTPSRPLKVVSVVFRAEVIGGELMAEVDGNTVEAGWFSLSDLPEPQSLLLSWLAAELR
jgi:8-oxo-dGTP diphosphatase